MFKKILLLACILASGLALGKTEGPEYLDKDLWKWGCSYMHIFHGTTCKGIERPKILWTEFRWTTLKGQPNKKMLGMYYHGSDYIKVNVVLLGTEKARSVTLHEAIHYIVHENNLDVDRCENEEIARRAHHAFEKTEYKDDWKEWYRCPVPSSE